ncbi:MAG: hypothetical protein SGI86_10840 [Deltaproteobacteria bacterium]|nr:hypothetical protein [Deltaproteobacteria bacterium]
MPAPLFPVLAVTFLASIAAGTFWSGIFFVAARKHGFSSMENLVLAVVMGVVYAIGAYGTGTLLRWSRNHLGPRGIVRLALGVLAAASLGPAVFPQSGAVLRACAILGGGVQAILWPVVESYLTSGRHGPVMRRAIGQFNTSWSSAVPVTLFAIPLLGVEHIAWAFWLTAICIAAAMVFTHALPLTLAAHDDKESSAATGADYPELMRAALWLLPMSYVLSSALGPLLPQRMVELQIASDVETALAATWLVVRALFLFGLSRVNFWHGRWNMLVVGPSAMLLGIAGVLQSPGVLSLVLSLALFGAGMAVIYTAALYYAMTVGHAAVDAGGQFEGRIGMGYVVGPVVGMTGTFTGTAWVTSVAASFVVVLAMAQVFRAHRRARARSYGPGL